jgi:hypothetical protein
MGIISFLHVALLFFKIKLHFKYWTHSDNCKYPLHKIFKSDINLGVIFTTSELDLISDNTE